MKTAPVDVENVRERFLADVLTQAMASHWDERARAFEQAGPRQGDYFGHATTQTLVDQAVRCAQTAAACRAKAHVLRRYGPPAHVLAEVADVLGEVADVLGEVARWA